MVIRPDAHSSLHKAYIRNGVRTLHDKPDVTAVGGILLTKAKGFWGNIIRVALSSPVGVGNSSFRTNTESTYTDTAVYAVYRKAIFVEVGYFDEKLVRHQDNEMHNRIHKAGGKFYLNTNMIADYFCRDTIPSLLKQMFNIGRYLPDVMFKGALSLRHMAPFAFYGAILIMIIIGLFYFHPLTWIAVALLVFYITVILAEAFLKSIKNKSLSLILLLFVIPLIHLSYAAGTCWGLIGLPGRIRKN
jgi:GT2 family glycosyltransferase